jgi:hypothetical protein
VIENKKEGRSTWNATAYNERFGKSGAVTRPKGNGNEQVLCLVSSAVEAPPSPSRHHVIGKRRTARVDNEAKFEKVEKKQ